MQVAYPYRIAGAGRTASDDDVNRHIRAMIEQVLFTTPGERVNRPDFGSGLLQFVFAHESAETLAAAHFLVQGALQQWLGDVIDVEDVEVRTAEAALQVVVRYTVLRYNQVQTATFGS